MLTLRILQLDEKLITKRGGIGGAANQICLAEKVIADDRTVVDPVADLGQRRQLDGKINFRSCHGGPLEVRVAGIVLSGSCAGLRSRPRELCGMDLAGGGQHSPDHQQECEYGEKDDDFDRIHKAPAQLTRSMVTDCRTTSFLGRSCAPRAAVEILSTMSCPSMTSPKIVCFPVSHSVGATVMKNCEPLVFGPALAMASLPFLSKLCGDPLVSS